MTSDADPRAILTQPGAPPDLVLRYGGAEHLVDLHLPSGGEPAPLVVLLHGGFWRDAYDRVHTRPLADALRRAGYAVATPEYRRTPGARWPQLRSDLVAARDALSAVLEESAPGRVARGPYRLLGHSAGGHLALWWGLTSPQTTAKVVALAPVADLARAHADDLGDGAVQALMGGSPRDQPALYADADVARRLPATEPPIVVIHGEADRQVPIAHSRGLDVRVLTELTGTEHFGLIDPQSSAWPVVRDALR